VCGSEYGKKEREKKARERKRKSQSTERKLEEGPSLGISEPELGCSWGDVRELSGLM